MSFDADLNKTEDLAYSDQQFISTAYLGKVNYSHSGDDKTLKYRVKFVASDKLFQEIEVNENQKVSAPINNPESPSEELTFKEWQLNDVAFNFDTIITNDIILVAKFEETPAPSGYTWNGTDTSEKDIIEGSYLYHWVSDNCPYTTEAYVGATIVRKKLDGSAEKTYTVLAEDITDMSEEDSVILSIAEDEATIINVIKNLDGTADGLFFDKSPADDTYWYVSSLTFAENL